MFEHLGKIIIYGAPLKASVIVWIVKKAKDEFRKAIEWLNNHTDGEISFFLIEVDAYKIGDSNPAPMFNIIEQPNDFADNVMLTDTSYIDFVISEKAKGGVGTRSSGKELRTYTLNTLKLATNPILLDFNGIDVISSSFADEFIGKLVNDIGIIEFANSFKIINANDFVKGLLNKAINERIKQNS